MNWGEFKSKVEAAGVTDTVEVVYIDIENCDEVDDIKICLLPGSNCFYVKKKLGLNDVVCDVNSK